MNDALYIGAYIWYFLLCIRARFCAVPQSRTEKENLPGFVLLTHFLVSRSCRCTIWTIFRCVCVHMFPGHLYFLQGHNRVGGWHWKGCFRRPVQRSSWGPPQPLAPGVGLLLLLYCPCSGAQAALQLHSVGWASAMAMRCLWWQPCQACLRTGTLLCSPPPDQGGRRERGPEHH